jgi:hypothetical protein
VSDEKTDVPGGSAPSIQSLLDAGDPELDISHLLEPHEVESMTMGGLDPSDYTVLPLQCTHIESRKKPDGTGRLVICAYEVQNGVFENDTALFLGDQAETEFLLNKIAFAPSIRLPIKKAELAKSVKEGLKAQLKALVLGQDPMD